jgi:hypothetical protein
MYYCISVISKIRSKCGSGRGIFASEGQTTQWPKKKGQKDKQRSTKHTYKDRVTPTSLKIGGELRCSGM